MTSTTDPFEERRQVRASIAAKNRTMTQVDHNGIPRPVAPVGDWQRHYDAASPTAQRAMASGARARAEKAEARVAELEAPPEPEPAQRDQFHAKNHVLLNRILGRPAAGNTPTKES